MTEHQYGEVTKALGPKLKLCPTCSQENSLILVDGFHLVPIHSSPRTTIAADSVIPTVVVTCTNCGHLQYHNVHIIGVAEVLGIPPVGR